MNKYSITSNEAKLFKHLDHLKNIQQGVGAPIMLVVSPTNICNSNCIHCCFSGRDKTLKLDFDYLKNCLRQFKDLGVRGIELAGGGEPTLYSNIEELIIFVTDTLGLKIGMNTNGLLLGKIKNIRKFEWIRLSLNFFDDERLETKAEEIGHTADIIKNKTNITACYIVSQELKTRNLRKVVDFANKHQIFTRIAPDCVQSKDKIKKLVDIIKKDLPKTENCFCSDFNVFLEDRPDNFCAAHFVKPLLFTDGWLYICPSFELAIENGKDVTEKFRVCRGDEALRYYSQGIQTFKHTCSYCKYAQQNEILYHILQETQFNEFV